MRRCARSRAVRPDDGIARQHAPPSVIAGHDLPLAVADLRQRGRRVRQSDRADENRKRQPPIGPHVVLQALISQPYLSSPLTGSRFKGFRATPERSRKSTIALYFQTIVEMAGIAPAVTCKSPPAPSREGPCGEMAEWLKAHAWKACVRETVPWVRIPLSPPACPRLDVLRANSLAIEPSSRTHSNSSSGLPIGRTALLFSGRPVSQSKIETAE